MSKRLFSYSAAAIAILGLTHPIGDAQARRISAARGCDEMVTLKHPDLKPGPVRRKEWSKCMADPDKYNG